MTTLTSITEWSSSTLQDIDTHVHVLQACVYICTHTHTTYCMSFEQEQNLSKVFNSHPLRENLNCIHTTKMGRTSYIINM